MQFVLASLFCITTFAASAPQAGTDPNKVLGSLPIRFEARGSAGPVHPEVQWLAHGPGYSISFTDHETRFRAGDKSVGLTFPGSRASRFEGTDPAAATNYFRGKDAVTLPVFHRLRRLAVYPGIDVVYYGDGGHLEYDFEIAPGADPSPIRMRFDGADSLRLDDRGSLVLNVGDGQLTQLAPVVYQKIAHDGRHSEVIAVESTYVLEDDGSVRIRLGNYNPANALVVDPSVLYAGYFAGSSGPDGGTAITHDTQGNVYLAGYDYSNNFPIVGQAEQNAEAGDRDVWVMQINLPSQTVSYSSYLGGGGADDLAAIAVDTRGFIYLTGSTNSTNFPVTTGGYTTTITANTHGYVTMLDPTQLGSAGLIYSTYFGGSGSDDEPTGIAVAGGKIYVTGFTNSTDFPTVGAYQGAIAGTYNAFISEFDPTGIGGASLLRSTYLGGAAVDMARTIALDSAGRVYIAGSTYSANFPTTSTAYNGSYSGDGDCFLAELDLEAPALLYATYLGGSSLEEVKKIVLDASGRVGMTGYTISPDFPVTKNAYQTAFGGNGNAFLTIIDVTKAGSAGLAYSSYFGGNGGEVAYGLAVDSLGRYYLGGYTLSSNLPVSVDALSAHSSGAGVDGFVAAINPAAGSSGLVYGSYITGPGTQSVQGVDILTPQAGPLTQVLIIGSTTSNVFPPGATTNTNAGHVSAFFLDLGFPAAASAAKSSGDMEISRRSREPR